MVKSLKYRILEKISENNRRTIYRVEDVEKTTYLAKILNTKSSTENLARLKHEDSILNELSGNKNVLNAFSIDNLNNNDVLIFEDFKGVTFQEYSLFIKSITNCGIHEINDLKEGLNIFRNVVSCLMELHEKNIVHRNLTPSSILIDPVTKEIKIIDFDVSSKFETKDSGSDNLFFLEKNPEYISPELTGRINSIVDYRTDFYSLGIIFYEFFTGIKPYKSEDIVEITYSHIAVKPIEPIDINKELYKNISNIIIKLLEKLPENRYQNAYGLLFDLEQCSMELQATGKISDFNLGSKDYSRKFKVSQKLYGRDKEINELKNILNSLSKGNSQFVMLSGNPGVGKSALINEVRKSVVEFKGYFASGKCEQFKRDISYFALLKALKKIVMQIMASSDKNLSKWRNRIIEELSPNTKIISDLIPELRKIFGDSPDLPKLKPLEAQNRFIKTLADFINLLSTKEHPVIVFLDDLQWCDQPTLKLLEYIAINNVEGYICIIGSYRDNEVMESHLLNTVLEEVEKKRYIHHIHLNSLDLNYSNMIVADSFFCDSDVSLTFSKLLYSKTQGNPFFIKELLESLYFDNLIYFDKSTKKWTWNLIKIQECDISENIVDFLTEKLIKLPEGVLETLKYASCIGTYFDLETLKLIQKLNREEILKRLEEAVVNGFLYVIESKYDLNLNSSTDIEAKMIFRFQHDKIQQAIYIQISEKEKKEMHLKIGRLLLEKYYNNGLNDNIIEIVSHLNECKEYIEDTIERNLVARLNYYAAKKAKNSSAYKYAFNYITTAIEFLSEKSWMENYEQTFEINKFYSECAYLCGEFEIAEEIIKILLEKAISSLRRAEIRLAQCELYAFIGRQEDSLNAGIIGLKELNIQIKPNPRMASVLKELVKVKLKLRKKSIGDIEKLSLISKPEVTIALKLLLNFIPVAYLSGNGNLFGVIVLKMTNLSLEYGNSVEAAAAYAGYTVLMAGLGDFKSAKEFGKLSLRMAEGVYDPERRGMIYVLYGLFSHSWNEEWKDMSKWFRKSVEEGLKSGEFLYASFACSYINLWDPGVEIEAGINEIKKAIDVIKETKYINAMYQANLILRKKLNLSGKTDNRNTFNISHVSNEEDISTFDENDYVENMMKINYISGVATYYLYKMQVNYIYNNYKEAFSNMQNCDKHIGALEGSPFSVEYCFYSFLTIASLYNDLSIDKKIKWFAKLKRKYKKMCKWAQNYSANFEHKKLIMEAEMCRLKGNTKEVLKLLDKSIEIAIDKNFLDDAAIANELAAIYCKKLNFINAANMYFRESHRLYEKWGAIEKAKQLREFYFYDYVQERPNNIVNNYNQDIVDVVDVMTIVKSSQILSSEIYFPELLRKLLKMIIENAGAQRGCIILKQDSEWLLQAELNVENNNDKVLQSIAIDDGDLPSSVINYSVASEEYVVLADASNEGEFTYDSYIMNNNIKSILCMPVKNQGSFNTILYLENNLLTNAFTLNRIRILELLSTQIAIAMENSRMYTDLKTYRDNLERLVLERTEELTKTLKHLKTTQNHLIESEKLAALGQLVAGVAHEINTPLGAINASIGNVFNYLNETLEYKLPKLMRLLTEEEQNIFFKLIASAKSDVFNITSREERSFKRQMKAELVECGIEDADSIASIMVDIGIYNEVETYLSLFNHKEYYFILQTAHELSGIKRNSETISRSVEMATKIVFALKNYAHQDMSSEMVSANIINGIETVLTIFKNKTKHSVKIIKKYSDIPEIFCYPDELNQVWTNIIFNSLQAMDFNGTLQIEGTYTDGNVIIRISDTGKGIPESVKEKIFEPFFTTKPQGEGTGLGLNIVKNIISKHNGSIMVESIPGNTVFTVIIPEI